MVTHPKGRRVAVALALAVGAASPCLAKLAEEDLSAGDGSALVPPSGLVRSFADDFTDAIQLVILQLGSGLIRVDYHIDGLFAVSSHFSDIPTATRREDHEGGLFAVSFFDGSMNDYYNRGTDVEVVFRVDSLEAVTLTGTWSWSHVQVLVSEAWVEELVDMVRGAETIIYRIGAQGRAQGDIRRISVPAEMPELVAEFRRRVAAVAGAE